MYELENKEINQQSINERIKSAKEFDIEVVIQICGANFSARSNPFLPNCLLSCPRFSLLASTNLERCGNTF